MAAITNLIISNNQEKSIATRQDLENYNKTRNALNYTPYVDIALSIICSVGAVIASTASFPVTLGFLGLAGIFLLSGVPTLKNKDLFSKVTLAVNQLWNLKFEYAKTANELNAKFGK